jgi:hypothetical protein
MRRAAASPFKGSVGLGYRSSCGRKTSKILIISNMGDQVWLMTSKQTDPDLELSQIVHLSPSFSFASSLFSVRFRLPPLPLYRQVHLQFVDVGVEDAVYESDTGGFVGVLVR